MSDNHWRDLLEEHDRKSDKHGSHPRLWNERIYAAFLKQVEEAKMEEKDPDGKPANEPGSKLDHGKPQLYSHLHTYFPRALTATCSVSEFGARKYTRMGWITVPDGIERYTEAMSRHLMYEAQGEIIDKDSGLMHASHLAWNALARLELMLMEEEIDVATDED